MKLIRPFWEILNVEDFVKTASSIELAARTCYKSENKISENSATELISKLIASGHEAMLEFGPSITVKFICDRGVSHELVRHRLCDFAQESTRYCNYSKDKFDNQITFILPSWIHTLEEGIYAQGETPLSIGLAVELWFHHMQDSEQAYNDLISEGWQAQRARSVLPNSLKTEIVVKANIREWRHIFRLRTSRAAHPQMRELMIPLLEHFQMCCPLLFSDIVIEK